MPMKYFTATIIIILTYFTALYSQTESNLNEFKIGLNSNYVFENSDYEGGHTGLGIFFEPFLSDNISVFFSYNQFELAEKNDFNFKSRSFRTRETNILLRFRLPEDHFTVYPEIGIGWWGSYGSYVVAGFGFDVLLTEKFVISSSVDYLRVSHNYFNINGSGWVRSVFKLNVNVSYKVKR